MTTEAIARPVELLARKNRLPRARVEVIVVACAAALPSIVWSFRAGWILDDWVLGADTRFDGAFSDQLPWTSRPAQALWISLTYSLLGLHPVLHALLLAALNAVAAGVALVLLRRHVPAAAFATVLLWAVIPNRDASRYWPAAAAILLGLVVGLVALLAIDRSRGWLAGACLVVATVTYEASGMTALALAVALLLHRRRVPGTVAVAVRALGPGSFAIAAAWLFSPRRGGPAVPFSTSGDILPAQVGIAIAGPLYLVTAFGVLAGVALVARRAVRRLPACPGDRAVALGVGLLVVGVLPFAATAFQFTTGGSYDRANTTAALGTSMVLVGAAMNLPRPIVRPAVGTLAVWFAVLALGDVGDWWAAQRDAQVLVDHLDATLPPDVERFHVTRPVPRHDGAHGFVAYGEVGDALALRRGRYPIEGTIAPEAVAPGAILVDPGDLFGDQP